MGSYGIQAYGQYKAGKAQKAALDYQAKVDKYNAELQTMAAEEEAGLHRGKVHSLISTQKAQYAAGGIDISQGSAVEVFANTAYSGEMDAQRIIYGGKVGATGLKLSARLRQYEGNVAKQAGMIQATATVAKGAESGAMMAMGMMGGGGGAGAGRVSASTMQYSPNQGYGGGEGGARGT